jgi:hypothetical protein
MNLLNDMLELFGLKIERRDSSAPPGVTRVNSRADIAGIFDVDAARQRSESMFFSPGGRRRVVIPTNTDSLL